MENRNGILETFWRFLKRHFDASFWHLTLMVGSFMLLVHLYYVLYFFTSDLSSVFFDPVDLSALTFVIGLFMAFSLVLAIGLFDRALEKMRKFSGENPDKSQEEKDGSNEKDDL